jgi:hypothetical protein
MESNIETPESSVMTVPFFLSNGIQGEMLIKDMTRRGLGCRHGDAPIAADDEISIEFPVLGLRKGIVRWTEGGNCGVQMLMPLDVEAMRFHAPDSLLPLAAAKPAPKAGARA